MRRVHRRAEWGYEKVHKRVQGGFYGGFRGRLTGRLQGRVWREVHRRVERVHENAGHGISSVLDIGLLTLVSSDSRVERPHELCSPT